MSYVVHIWQSPVPRDLDDAWEIIGRLVKEQDQGSSPTPPALIEFVRRITARYPDLMDLSNDEDDARGVWTDGPMQANGPIEIVGIRSQWVDEVQPFVVAQANSLGLACFDMQRGEIYLPGARPKSPPKKNWWQFWR